MGGAKIRVPMGRPPLMYGWCVRSATLCRMLLSGDAPMHVLRYTVPAFLMSDGGAIACARRASTSPGRHGLLAASTCASAPAASATALRHGAEC